MTTSRSGLRVLLAHATYAVLVHLACVVALVPAVLRGLADREHARWLLGRLGRLPEDLPRGRPVWIHAVSVGEVKASRPLVAALRVQYPDIPLVLSTGTPTGAETARRLFPGLPVIAAPIDLPWVVRRVVRRVAPRLLLLMELEVWPAFLRCIDEAGIPQVIVNGRVSAGSFRTYMRLRWWLPEFDRIDLVAAQDSTYADRLTQLGIAAERVHVTGNLKHDLIGGGPAGELGGLGQSVQQSLQRSLQRSLGLDDGRPVFVAGSTHDGEDAQVVRAWQAAGGGQAAHLVLVPRHLPRLKDIGRLLGKLGVPFVLRSEADGDAPGGPASGTGPAPGQLPGWPPETVLLVDTMGELEAFFALADVVFLGGSLTPVGGHNVLEPAAAGCPILVGPHLETCRREADILLAAGGLEVVPDEATLGASLARLLGDPAQRQRMGAAAKSALLGLQGATAETLRLLHAHHLLCGSSLDHVGECSTLGRPSPAETAGTEGTTATRSHTGSPPDPTKGSSADPSPSPRTGASLP